MKNKTIIKQKSKWRPYNTKIRRMWKIKPFSRIKKSKKTYDRKKVKQKSKKEIEQEIENMKKKNDKS